MQIQWTDTDPATGARRFVCAEKFAGRWEFKSRPGRRGEWTRGVEPTRSMWLAVLDALRRRLPRREGVTEADVKQVERVLAEWKPKFGDPEEEEE